MTVELKDQSAQMLTDIITTAVEGGIGYWSALVVYRWTEGPEHTHAKIVPATDEFDLHDDDGGELFSADEPAEITPEVVRLGMERIINGEAKLRSDIVAAIAQSVAEQWGGHIDSEIADCIVQVGLFGETIWS